ncbi:MAG: ABC transporter ATP-binding protein [Candidatus Rokuibacteriota bacterium]|nr:MAG: ABC transporter ATP-binding protein [Candidatus Rokubacteria bacterium]
MAALLELTSVVTYRGPAQVLRGISLTVGERESVCLVGRNGAGKTTTIDTIMGLLPSRSGSVSFNGQDVTRLPAHRRARLGIGYAPEDTGVFPDLTVGENFEIARWLARDRDGGSAASGDAFSVFPEVQDLLGRRGLNLSGGQKKMVAITRAMTLKPSILLLDEPFEGLAPVVVTRFIDAVRAIKAMGISILIAESNVTNSTRVADRLYALDRGDIIYQGLPQRVFDDAGVMRTLRG